MATINVTDDPYGAVGDGVEDDSQAIQDAIDDTSSGDTVLIPETDDYYRVYRDTGTNCEISVHTAADNVTITGEGVGSKIIIENDSSNLGAAMGIANGTTPNWTSLTIQKLVLDGGGVEYSSVNENCAPYRHYLDSPVTGKDLLIEDCIFQNGVGTANFGMGGNGLSTTTVRNCTSRDGDSHGFQPSGTGEGTTSDPEIKLIDVKATNTSTAIDFNNGNHIVDGLYADSTDNGMKCGSTLGAVDHVTLKRVNNRNGGNKGFYQTHDVASWSLNVEDCLFVGHLTDGFELRDSCDCTVTGTLMVEDCANDSENNIEIIESSSIDASSATVISQHADLGVGFHTFGAGDVHLGTYYHYNNADGAYTESADSFQIDEQINEEKAEIDVPGQNDVGAFVTSSATSNLVWETESDWDNAQSEFGVHHEQPTGSSWAASDVVEQGMPTTDPEGSSLAAYWTFDETSGSTFNDVSGNGMDATVVDSPDLSATGVLGGTAINTSTGDDHAYFPNTISSLESTYTEWSAVCWVKVDSIVDGRIWDFSGQRNLSLRTRSGDDDFYFVDYDGSNLNTINSGTITTGAWYYTAMVMTESDGTYTYEMFLGSPDDSTYSSMQSIGTVSTGSASESKSEQNAIGGDPDSAGGTLTDAYDGTVDELRIYNRSLSSSELSDRYQVYL